jgi:hypothetical protein
MEESSIVQYGMVVIDAIVYFFFSSKVLSYSRENKSRKIPYLPSLITATLNTGEPAGAYEAGHQADPPHPRLVLRGEEPQSLRDKLNRARK